MQLWGVKKTDRFRNLFSIVLLTTALIIQSVPFVFASPLLANRYDKTSTSRVAAVGSHLIGFSFTNSIVLVGSLEFQFCSNDPIPENACTAPSGFDASAAVITNQTGETGFVMHPNSTANDIILTRGPTVPVAASSTYEFNNITNPNVIGTYYIRLRSFSSVDATGSPVEVGGIALSIDESINVSTEVPPYLTFCVGTTIPSLNCASATGAFIDLGELSVDDTRFASSQFMAATNAAFGYSITISGTSLTSGTHVIPGLSSQTASTPGTSQFGINLKANSSPPEGSEPNGPGTALPAAAYNIANRFRFQTGDTLVSVSTSNDYRRFTTTYIVNIGSAQQPGIYSTTLNYICLANF